MGARIPGQKRAIVAALRAVRLFASWPDAALEELAGECELWRYDKDSVIAWRDETPRGFWCVATGSAVSYRSSAKGHYFLQGIHWPGDVFGLVATVDGLPLPLSHAARTDSTVVFVPRAAFQAALRANVERMHELSVFICGRSRVDFEAIYAVAAESLPCRLAKFLAFLTRRSLLLSKAPLGAPGWIDASPIDLTQDEMASMLGVARQTLNRTIGSFIRDKIVVRSGDAVRIVDFRALLAVMEESEPLPSAWRAEILSWDKKLQLSKKGENFKSVPEKATAGSPARKLR
jgi:CRP-like cAMP-binding protein